MSDNRVANPTQIKNIGYFTLDQCLHSKIAQMNKIDNIPGSDYLPYKDIRLRKDQIILNLHQLFKYCINPIYRKYKENLGLVSVYRNKEVNKILGGVENSQHIYGYAADLVLIDGTPSLDLFNWCRINIPQYHQLIWEYPEKEGYNSNNLKYEFSWIHISYIVGSNFKEHSISSKDPHLHKKYEGENTFSVGNFTHNISTLEQ